MKRPSVVFLDRDGTIVRDVEYLARPEQLEILPGAARAIARLNRAEIPVVIVTNQSGIARGLFTVADYECTEQRLEEMLAEDGAHVTATYFCPHLPDITGPCDCRKPGTALFRRAASTLHLDMSHPAFVGDRWRDVAPVLELGGVAVLLHAPGTPPDDERRAASENIDVSESLEDAVDRLLGTVLVEP